MRKYCLTLKTLFTFHLNLNLTVRNDLKGKKKNKRNVRPWQLLQMKTWGGENKVAIRGERKGISSLSSMSFSSYLSSLSFLITTSLCFVFPSSSHTFLSPLTLNLSFSSSPFSLVHLWPWHPPQVTNQLCLGPPALLVYFCLFHAVCVSEREAVCVCICELYGLYISTQT